MMGAGPVLYDMHKTTATTSPIFISNKVISILGLCVLKELY